MLSSLEIMRFMKQQDKERKAEGAARDLAHKEEMAGIKRTLSGMQETTNRDKDYNWQMTFVLRDLIAFVNAAASEYFQGFPPCPPCT